MRTHSAIFLAIILMFGLTAHPARSFAQAGSNGSDDFIMTPDMLKRKAKENAPEQPAASPQIEPKTTEQDTQKPTEASAEPKTSEAKSEASKENTPPPSNQTDSAKTENGNPAKPEDTTEKKEGESKPAESEKANADKSKEPAEPAKVEAKVEEEVKQEIKIKKDKDILALANWKGTLMLNPKDLNVLMAARQVYLEHKDTGGNASGEGGADQEGLKLTDEEIAASKKGPTEIKAPVITLDSIAYFDSKNWILWINGTKYTPESKVEGFTIKSVSGGKVTIAWNAALLDMMFPEWKNMSTQQGDKWVLKRGNNEIYIDENTLEVSFNLYPNQTFLGRELDIMEGKVQNSSGFDVIPISSNEAPSVIDKALDALMPKNKHE